MTSSPTPFWLAGRAATGGGVQAVRHPDGTLVAEVWVPTDGQVEQAVAAAEAVRLPAQRLTLGERSEALSHVAARLLERQEEIARLITAENGKPIKWARIEVARASSVFRWAAEEARRWNGDVQRLDTEAATAGRMALVRRVPKGTVLAIAPFNFPLNLVAHKVAPALAVGTPVIVKPAPATPMSALLLGELLAETDLPDGMWSVLPIPERPDARSSSRTTGCRSSRSPARPRSATRSSAACRTSTWSLNSAATPPRSSSVTTAPTPTCSGPRSRIATFANYQAGQSCISVQRVLVDRSVCRRAGRSHRDRGRALVCGDPYDDATDVGPLGGRGRRRRA